MMIRFHMNGSLGEPPNTSQVLAGRAANWALGMSIASIAFAGVGVWLAVTFGLGIIPLLLGLLGWALCLAVGMGFAMGALKIAAGIVAPGQARMKAWSAIGLSAFSLVLVVLYIFALVLAIQQLAQ
jgi:hypothetical protein